jgi:tagatose 6-phosphate kinase
MIATVTMNASLDKEYRVGRLEPGGSVVVDEVRFSAGGRGLNVARALVALGAEVLALGVVGGRNGALIREDLDRSGIGHDFTESRAESRCRLSIADESTGRRTELVEPGPELEAEAMEDLRTRFRAAAGNCRVVAVSGGLPPGAPMEFYRGLASVGRSSGAAVILDTGGAALKAALSARPDVIKPNLDELRQMVGRPISGREDILEAAGRLVAGGVGLAVVSMGPAGALFYSREEILEAVPPKVEEAPAGCGDCLVAGLALAISEGRSLEDSARLAVAVSAAGAMAPRRGGFDAAKVDEVLPQVAVTRLA